MIQAIFFDFNGVIIDDERLQLAAYQEVLRDHAIDLTEADYFGALGMDDKTFVRAAFERSNKVLTDEVLGKVLSAKGVQHRKLIEDELPLFAGVVTFLKAASRNFQLGLVSMASLSEIDYVLDRARLQSLFRVIVSAEDVTVCKPAPDCYRVGLEKLNAQRTSKQEPQLMPADCLVVEDSPAGIEAGKQAGMRTLAVTNTVAEGALRAANADVVTASLADWNVDAVRHVFS
ncbi:MAG TPA: HAD family phosphatase [Pyrinomonadaceae bacterium]|nr:HAD family phosphatase [Pyrinomonadaceae bacterium]